MPATDLIPPIPGITLRPACPKCSTPMVLTQINPDERGFDNRHFDCPKCGQSEAWVVKGL
jgi:hypothetical protein